MLHTLCARPCTGRVRPAVLSGGGAATVYAPEAYQSRDLDFIVRFWASSSDFPAEAPLRELGFIRSGTLYTHPETVFTLEFPIGPLSVGEEEILSWRTLTRVVNPDGNWSDGPFVDNQGYLLHILNPTDCVRDRLAWFLHYNDFSGLSQAVSVARKQDVDLEIIKRWCEAEGAAQKFKIFLANLNASY